MGQVVLWVAILLGLTWDTGWTQLTSRSKVTLKNNGYTGILVAIHEDVPENAAIVNAIKDMFKEASNFLYTATQKRAYFQEVTILLPSTWTTVTADGGVASGENFEVADVVVASATPATRALPHTRSYGGCGQPGIRIFLTPEFFLNATYLRVVGPRGRLLVHEWGHFRWGVFDEYPQEGDPQFYFSPTTGNVEPVRCNVNMMGAIYYYDNQNKLQFCHDLDSATGSYPDYCRYRPNPSANRGKITASIMDRQELPPIIYFCDDDKSDPKKVHNAEANSQQNRICGQRSTWAVISESADFRGGQNSPTGITSTDPTFRLLKAPKTRRVALVLDTSSSITDDTMLRMRQGAATYLQDGARDEDEVALVAFSNGAQVLAPLTPLGTPANRERLKDLLPSQTGGDTSIGAGLLRALEMLTEGVRNGSYAQIVVVSDGKETLAPYVSEIVHRLIQSGTVVSVIVLSIDADDTLANLASVTGGQFFYEGNDETSTGLMDAFIRLAISSDHKPANDVVQLISKAWVLGPGDEVTATFFLDGATGRDTSVTITYSWRRPTVVVTSPTGRQYKAIYPEYHYDPLVKLVRISIPDKAENGTWTCHVTNGQNQSQRVTILALSRPYSSGQDTVRVTAIVSTDNITWPDALLIYADVTAGVHPVTGLKVKAVVFRPLASAVEIDLYDNGAGADVRKNDGVYSRYFTQFSTAGRYSVRVEVENTAASAILVVSAPDLLDNYSNFTVPSGVILLPVTSLSRTTSGGGFQLSANATADLLGSIDVTSQDDVFSPVRIIDLRVLRTSHSNRTVVLGWTAPGGDLDHDTAAGYEIFIGNNTDDLLGHSNTSRSVTSSEVIIGALWEPQAAGNREVIVLRVDLQSRKNVSYVFTVRAVDSAGNRGEFSNFVTAGFGYVPDYIDPEYGSVSLMETSTPDAKGESKTSVIAGILGGSLTLIVLVIVISGLLQLLISEPKQEDIEMQELDKQGRNIFPRSICTTT